MSESEFKFFRTVGYILESLYQDDRGFQSKFDIWNVKSMLGHAYG